MCDNSSVKRPLIVTRLDNSNTVVISVAVVILTPFKKAKHQIVLKWWKKLTKEVDKGIALGKGPKECIRIIILKIDTYPLLVLFNKSEMFYDKIIVDKMIKPDYQIEMYLSEVNEVLTMWSWERFARVFTKEDIKRTFKP